MDDDTTFFQNSVYDRQKFVARRKSLENYQDNIRGFPNLKLNITDSFGFDLDTSVEGNNHLSNTSSFLQKHQQNIAGFDIAQKLGEKDRQILECKTNITILEGKLENLKSLYKTSKFDYEKEIENYKAKQFQDKGKIEILEEKVKKLTDKKQNDLNEMFKNRESGEFHRSQKEKSLMERNKFYAEKIDELQEKVTHLSDTKYELMNMLNEKSNELEKQKNENKILEERISSFENQVADLLSAKRDLDILETKFHQSEINNKELMLKLECLKEQESKLDSFEDTILKLPKLEKEITKLKEENNMHKITRLNIDLLKEQLTSAENRLELMEIKCRDLTGENATLVTLRDLSEEYESVIRKEFNLEYLPPVSEFLEILRNLKKQDEVVEQSLNELKASVESHSSSKTKLEEINNSLQSELEDCHLEIAKNAAVMKRLQRKIFLLSKERDSLQSVIESYQSEAGSLNPSSVEQEQINHLETQLSNYRKEISKLEEELNKAQQLPKFDPKLENKNESSNEISCANKDTDTESSLAQLKEENELLKTQIENYKNLGDQDLTKDKVIHFRDNPLDKAYNKRKASFNKLSEENEALKKRVKSLEGFTANLKGKVGMKGATDETKNKRIKELEEEVKSLEMLDMRNRRMLEALNEEEEEEPQELREIVFQLLGYRIDFEEDKCYKLISIYAESQEDYLLFKQSSDGEMKLIENKFSDSLDDMVKSYLYQDNSSPAFLSSITLDLYGRQTTMPSSDQEEEYEGGEEDEEPLGEEEEEEYMGEEEEEEEEENSLEPAAKRPRQELEDEDPEEEEEDEEEEEEEEDEEENNEEEEDDDDDELICLD